MNPKGNGRNNGNDQHWKQTKKKNPNNQWNQRWFFRNSNVTHLKNKKTQGRLTEKKEKTQITNNKNEIRTTDTADIQGY